MTATEVIIDPRDSAKAAATPRRGSTFVRFLKRPAGAVSFGILVLVLLVAFFAPLLSPHDPNFVDLALTKAAPSAAHPPLQPAGAPTVAPSVASAILPHDLSPWSMFMNADIVVKCPPDSRPDTTAAPSTAPPPG